MFYSFKILHIYTPYLALFHLLPPNIHSPLTFSFQFHVFFYIHYLFNPLSAVSVAHMHVSAGLILWSIVNLPVAAFLKRNDAPFPGSHQLSIASQLGVELSKALPSLC